VEDLVVASGEVRNKKRTWRPLAKEVWIMVSVVEVAAEAFEAVAVITEVGVAMVEMANQFERVVDIEATAAVSNNFDSFSLPAEAETDCTLYHKLLYERISLRASGHKSFFMICFAYDPECVSQDTCSPGGNAIEMCVFLCIFLYHLYQQDHGRLGGLRMTIAFSGPGATLSFDFSPSCAGKLALIS
jgi:hypothetical protein